MQIEGYSLKQPMVYYFDKEPASLKAASVRDRQQAAKAEPPKLIKRSPHRKQRGPK